MPDYSAEPVTDENGRVDERVPCDVIVVPRVVELEGDFLRYQYYTLEPASPVRKSPRASSKGAAAQPAMVGRLPSQTSPAPEMLDEFMKLADDDDGSRVLRFARRWGVLHLCAHGLPVAQPPVPHLFEFEHVLLPSCAPLDSSGDAWQTFPIAGSEALAHWRQWAARARALLRVAEAVRSLKPGSKADWKVVVSGIFPAGLLAELPGDPSALGRTRSSDQQFLTHFVNAWVRTGRVAPMLVLRSNRPVMRLGGTEYGKLFGLIGLQLMIRISRVGSSAICSQCGRPYKPLRAPNPTRASFCGTCRARGVPSRHAKARYTERMLKARELFQRGVPEPEIARQVGSRLKTVRGWLRTEKEKHG